MSEKTKPKSMTGYSDKPIALIRNVGSQPSTGNDYQQILTQIL